MNNDLAERVATIEAEIDMLRDRCELCSQHSGLVESIKSAHCRIDKINGKSGGGIMDVKIMYVGIGLIVLLIEVVSKMVDKVLS